MWLPCGNTERKDSENVREGPTDRVGQTEGVLGVQGNRGGRLSGITTLKSGDASGEGEVVTGR